MSGAANDNSGVRHEPFGMVPVSAIQACAGDATALAVYVGLATYANRDGVCWPHQDEIAERLCVSVSTVKRGVAKLKRLCLVSVEPILDGFKKVGNRYTLEVSAATLHDVGRADLTPLRSASPDTLIRARDRSSRKEQTMNKNRPPGDDQPTLAIVTPITPGKLLDVPDVTRQVFDAWRGACGKTSKCLLTPKREKVIKARVAEGYELQDLLDAVRGWKHSPFHCGDNDSGTIYNELTLLLRDGDHVEKFRDLWRAGPPKAKRQPSAAERFLQRQREAGAS